MEIKCFSFLSLIQSYLNLYYTCPLDTLYPEDEVHVLLSKKIPLHLYSTRIPSLSVCMCMCECVNVCMHISQDASLSGHVFLLNSPLLCV